MRKKDRNLRLKKTKTKKRSCKEKAMRFHTHTSPAISNKAIFNRSLTPLHFCAWASLRRITADDLTLSFGNMTLQPI